MSADAFKQARDFLFAQQADYTRAHRDFRWPKLETFNYALDWFDAELARGVLADKPALKIVGDGGATRSFAELSVASSRLANGLRNLGVKRGDRILLMLGNVVPLWETMLAAMKLGAVVIPATTLLTPRDLKDRFDRGRVRHLVARAADAAKFDGLDPTVTRIAVDDAPAGWHRYDDLLTGTESFTPDGPTHGHRSAAAVFHLRHHVAAETGGAQPPELPGRPSDHDVLARAAAGRHASEHLLARLGEACL